MHVVSLKDNLNLDTKILVFFYYILYDVILQQNIQVSSGLGDESAKI